MRKIITFFAGLFFLVTALGALVATGAIYNTSQKQEINKFFFQPAQRSSMRPGTPKEISKIAGAELQDIMIAKYLYEYFYVVPYDNIESRSGNRSALRMLSSPTVFENWTKNVAPEIQKMSEDHMLRTVSLKYVYKPENSEYVEVAYELYTWTRPNDMATVPVITKGKMQMNVGLRSGKDVIYTSLIEQQFGSINNYLNKGYPTSGLIAFRVYDIIENK